MSNVIYIYVPCNRIYFIFWYILELIPIAACWIAYLDNRTPLAEMLSTAIQFSHTGFINKKDSFGYGDFDSKLGFSVQEIPLV